MSQQQQKFQNQVVWVSGAAKGIGRGIALHFARTGAKVALVDIDEGLGEELAHEITKEGGTAQFIPCDMGKEVDIKRAISQTSEIFGGINILINNAGIILVKPLHELSSEEWDEQLAINLKAYFLSFKYAYPYLKANKQSYVVNMGSVNSFVGQAHTPAYNASKSAILNLSKSIAIDYAADGIRCNTVCPGITDTPMLRKHMPDDESIRRRLERVPTKKILSTADIAKSVAYLSCEDSAGVTGTNIVIDGGYLATAEWGDNHHE